MRLISKSVVAGVATMSVLALGASSASATITPSTGTVTASNTGGVTQESSLLTNTCTTVDFHGDINMNNSVTQGGGGIVTGRTSRGCSPVTTVVGDFATPWTLNMNNEVSAGTWTGTLTGITMTVSFCTFTGNLNLEYSNSTGLMSVTGGALNGGACGSGTVTGKWDLRTTGGVIPQFS